MPINCELPDDRAQPAAQTAAARIVRELARRRAVRARTQAVKLSPDRLRQLFGRVLARAVCACRRQHGRAILRDQLLPRRLVAAFARDDETQIVCAQSIEKFVDDLRRCRRLGAQQILFDDRAHARAERRCVEPVRIGRTRHESRCARAD